MIQFQEDHFTYDKMRRGFFLAEPDTPLGDRITRTDVTQFPASQGWTQITTIELDEGPKLGVIDVWTKSDDLE